MPIEVMESLAGVAPFSVSGTASQLPALFAANDLSGYYGFDSDFSSPPWTAGLRVGLSGREVFMQPGVTSDSLNNRPFLVRDVLFPGNIVAVSCRLASEFISCNGTAREAANGFYGGGMRFTNLSLSSDADKARAPCFHRDIDGRVWGSVGATVGPAFTSAEAGWKTDEPNCLDMTLNYSNNAFTITLNGFSILAGTFSSSMFPKAKLRFGFGAIGYLVSEMIAWGDFMITDAPLGEYRIKVLQPSADVESDFVPDTGTDVYSRINEAVSDGDASYAAATDGGSKAVLDYTEQGTPLDLGPEQNVMTIRYTVNARNENPDARELLPVFRQAGMDAAPSNGVLVTGVYQPLTQFIDMNPVTGLAWQREDFDNWAFGFQIIED